MLCLSSTLDSIKLSKSKYNKNYTFIITICLLSSMLYTKTNYKTKWKVEYGSLLWESGITNVLTYSGKHFINSV